MCQPGRPGPQGLSHAGSPGFALFQRAKSAAAFFDNESEQKNEVSLELDDDFYDGGLSAPTTSTPTIQGTVYVGLSKLGLKEKSAGKCARNYERMAKPLDRKMAKLAGGRRVHGLVQGRACRLLHDGDLWTSERVQERLSQALTPGTPPMAGAAFVEGFLAGAGTVLLHDHELLGVVDGWLASLTTDAFGDIVALLRRTFGSFEPAERRQLMRVAMGADTIRPSGFGDDVDPRRAADVLVTVRAMLGLPEGEPVEGEPVEGERVEPADMSGGDGP